MLVGCTVWQLLSLRIKKHHLTQSKLADELMKISKSNFRGKKLCVRLMDLTLRNPNVLCFLNTVFLTTFWVHLLCSDFNMMTWGKLTLPLQTLLLAEMAAPSCLRTHPLFQDMLEQWQVLRAHGQQDYGEFLCFYLGWLGTKLVSQAYQRRFLTDAGVVIAEENKGYAPILLHADLWQESRAQSQLSNSD